MDGDSGEERKEKMILIPATHQVHSHSELWIIPQQYSEISIVLPILQMRRLRLRVSSGSGAEVAELNRQQQQNRNKNEISHMPPVSGKCLIVYVFT